MAFRLVLPADMGCFMRADVASGIAAAQKHAAFRCDINGLRAWAVLAVVFYHFAVPGFAGGFVGVDVFFVISGFLMTGIISGGLQRDTFSLWRFYLARARRIMPAAAAAVCSGAGLGLVPHDAQGI